MDDGDGHGNAAETSDLPPMDEPMADEGSSANAMTSNDNNVITTCETSDRLLDATDSSQETMTQDGASGQDDVTMEEGGDETGEVSEPPRFEELPTGGDTAMDDAVPNATMVGNGETDNSASTVKATANGDVDQIQETNESDVNSEHPALEAERHWFGDLPEFVVQVYANQRSDTAIEHGFPECIECAANNRRALSSAVCMETTCAFKDKPVCSDCYEKQHLKDTHHPTRITKACPHCTEKKVDLWCVQCDLSFCRECFREVHSGLQRVMRHKSFYLDGASGMVSTCAKWSPHFMLTMQKMRNERIKRQQAIKTNGSGSAEHSPRGSGMPDLESPYVNEKNAANVSLKRKRSDEPPEIICIDDDDNDSAPKRPISALQRPISTPSSAIDMAVPTRSNDSYLQLRPPQIGTTSDQLHIVPSGQALVTRAGYIPEMPITPPTVGQSPFSVSSAVPTPLSTPVPVSSFPPASSNGNAWSSASAPTTPMAVPQGVGVSFTSSTLSNPSLGAINPVDENPIENALYHRLDRVSNNIGRIERNIADLNAKVVQASYQSVQAAQNLMNQLQQQQKQLVQLLNKRDVVVVHLVAQSKTIIQKVKVLRLDLLGDIPQVQAACYRRSHELSLMIQQAQAAIITLNARMTQTLDQAGSVSTEVFHRTVSNISAGIQAQEQEVVRRKAQRENEIVRLVQYHHGIRDMLKRAVQQQQHIRHQQEQQQQQQQQQVQQHAQQQTNLQQQLQQPPQQNLQQREQLLDIQKQVQFQQQLIQQQLLQQRQKIMQPMTSAPFSAPMQHQPIPMPQFIAPATSQPQQNGSNSYGNPPVSAPQFP